MGCGGGQSRKIAQDPASKSELLSILPEGAPAAKKLEEPQEELKPPSNPANAVWKEISTNDESLCRKDGAFGSSHKHVKSSRAFAEDIGKRKRPEKRLSPEDARSREIDQLLRDIAED